MRPRPARARPWVWYLVGVAGVVAVLAFALLNRPANPAGVAQPLSTHASFPVKLPAHVVRDSTLTLAGSLSAYSEGAVTVEGQWTGGPWIVLGTGALHPDRAYRVSVNLHWQGLVQLKVELPDGSVGTGTIAVT